MKKSLVFIVLITLTITTKSQVNTDGLRQLFLEDISSLSARLDDENSVERFYELNGYNLVWMGDGSRKLRESLFHLLASAPSYGLEQKDYQYTFIQSINEDWAPATSGDSLLADIRLTDAAIRFLTGVAFGNQLTALSYLGIRFQPDKKMILDGLYAYSYTSSLQGLVDQIEPHCREYEAAKALFAHLKSQVDAPGFEEVLIKSNKVDGGNKLLLKKLFQLGIMDSVYAIDQKSLVRKLQQAQKMLYVLNDGVLRSTTLVALNIPLRQRREEVRIFLSHLRYIRGVRQQMDAAILNIPAATLFVYMQDTLKLSSRVIVGKPSTPTPTLTSRITEVVAYPYWHVPYKIATRELLPMIKHDLGYLAANNFEVLNRKGQVLDPSRIRWKELSRSYFPYTIRQSTGCDNSLGVLKFNFNNPFSVYLHDTPGKGLFYLNKRYFSHGCMRVDKAVELAQLVLAEKASDIDTLIKRCLRDQKPKTIAVAKPLAVFVLYSTVWYSENGEIQFYDDVYKKLNVGSADVARN